MNIRKSNWITAGTEELAPVFIKTFTLAAPVKSAAIAASALGLYEIHINGIRVGDLRMTPGWTSYKKRVQWQEYDITALLKEENEIVISTAEGWCTGTLAWENHHHLWSDRIAVIATLKATLENGECVTVNTDDSWSWGHGRVVRSEIYNGEIYDRQAEITAIGAAEIYDHTTDILIPQDGCDIREIEWIPAKELIITPEGDTVIDFGQEVTGYVSFSVKGEAGHTCSIQHAEILDAKGNFYIENLRAAKAMITYTCNGERCEYHPHFTFMGFRYIRLNNWPEKVDLKEFRAVVVHSDMKRTGHFECSNPELNRLYENIVWGQRGNFLDVPTDCPQRDERLGWTGDAQAFVRCAAYNYNVHDFFRKWLRDLAADQREDGRISAVIPDVLGEGGAGSAAWGDAAVICPWQVYMAYGDLDLLREHFPAMKKWVDWIRAQGEREEVWNTGGHYGDWLNLDPNYKDEDQYMIATAYFAYSCSLVIKAGKLLGYDMSEYEALHARIVEAFRTLYMQDGRMLSRTQTAHVLAVYFDLCREEEKAALTAELAQLIHEVGDHLATGFVGTPYLMHVLSENGQNETAYSLLLRREYPSWLYPVTMGATTIWERWNGIFPDGTINTPSMNSFNHYAYGAVGDWMMGRMAGITPIEPGYTRVALAPMPDPRVEWVKASIDTAYGTIASEWKHEGAQVTYTFTIPAGVTAEITIGGKTEVCGEGTYSYTR